MIIILIRQQVLHDLFGTEIITVDHGETILRNNIIAVCVCLLLCEI